MADVPFTKCLDPKLRRLVRSIHDSDLERLELDRRTGFICAPPDKASPNAGLAPSDSKRVLVQVDRDQPPEDIKGLMWHRVVDGTYSVNVPITRLREVADHPLVKFVESGNRMTIALNTSIPAAAVDRVHADPPNGHGLHGKGVVVGIIDFGFDVTLADFDDADGNSRIAFLWDQSLTPQGNEAAPLDFGYGVEYTQKDIEAARKLGDPFSRVRHKPDVGAHGTHVAGIAAGNGKSSDSEFGRNKYVGVADAATLILVQPGIAGVQSAADSTSVVDAVDFIFSRADGDPCVINVSLGWNGGSHDGDSLVERTIDRLLDRAGRALVVAAGNEHVWRTHASGEVSGKPRTLHWRVGTPPDDFHALTRTDKTPNEMEIWYSSRGTLSVRVIDPDGKATDAVSPDASESFDLLGGGKVHIDSERFSVLNGDSRIHLDISSPGGTLKTGTWQVVLTPSTEEAVRFDAWIERDRRDDWNGFANQSSFENEDFDPSITLGTPATARRTIAVANYDHRLTTINESSGRGPTRDGRPKPDCSAPGTAILSSCALGTRVLHGSATPVRIAITGTSMAAPHVTGIVALLFERAHPQLLSADQVRKMITASASPAPGVNGFDLAWGFGRVDANAAVELIAELGKAPVGRVGLAVPIAP